GNFAEEEVADGVAEAVVDKLEAVEIDVEEGHEAALLLEAAKLAFELIGEVAAVGKSGEGVCAGLFAEALLCFDGNLTAAFELEEHAVEAVGELRDFGCAFDGELDF